jgi:hypothetical protein
MKKVSFSGWKENIQPGDLLLWGASDISKWKNTVLSFIRLMTWSKFGHVGIAARKGGGPVCIVEAVIPEVRITELQYTGRFYHIPMHLNWSPEAEIFIFDKVGLGYSMMDAVRAYLGVTLENDHKWQCAELAHDFYQILNVDLGNAYTPKAIAKNAVELRATEIYKIVRP